MYWDNRVELKHVQSWSELLAPLVNMIKEGSENKSALLILLIFYKINFFSNTRWTQLLVPLEILMSKISLKYIPIHIHNFEHSRVIMKMRLSSHGFLFHRNINRRENKAQIPLIIITMRKTKEYISDEQQKIIELHKLVKWL